MTVRTGSLDGVKMFVGLTGAEIPAGGVDAPRAHASAEPLRLRRSAPPSLTPVCTSEEGLFSEFAGDVDMADIIDRFVEGLPGRMGELRTAIAVGATADVKRMAHQLKGAAGGYGFGPITTVAGELELAIGRCEGAAETQEIVGRLLAMCARARACEPVAEAV